MFCLKAIEPDIFTIPQENRRPEIHLLQIEFYMVESHMPQMPGVKTVAGYCIPIAFPIGPIAVFLDKGPDSWGQN
jgi:hypothetical protein